MPLPTAFGEHVGMHIILVSGIYFIEVLQQELTLRLLEI